MNQTQSRIPIIDNLRGIAIILMLLQHIPIFLSENLENYTYYLCLFLSRFSAPLFFILSGYCVYLSYKNRPQNFLQRIFKRSVEIFLLGTVSNILRFIPIIYINVLHSISLFILICAIVLYIKSRSLYFLIGVSLFVYSFLCPSVINDMVILGINDIPIYLLSSGEYPVAAWLIYSVMGLGIAWFLKDFEIYKPTITIVGIILFVCGLGMLLMDTYTLSFNLNTPPFMFMMFGLLCLIYVISELINTNFLGIFGRYSLFTYVIHLATFSFIPRTLGLENKLHIQTTIIIYFITLIILWKILKWKERKKTKEKKPQTPDQIHTVSETVKCVEIEEQCGETCKEESQ